MTHDGFLDLELLSAKFGLTHEEREAWAAATQSMQMYWAEIVDQQRGWMQKAEWLGLFHDDVASIPSIIWQTQMVYHLQVGVGNVEIPQEYKLLKINKPTTCLLQEVPIATSVRILTQGIIEGDTVHRLRGIVKRIRVITVLRGPKSQVVRLYYGVVQNLTWDLGKFL